MVCSHCGRPLAPGAAACSACGAAGIAPAQGGFAASRPAGSAVPAVAVGPAHAGFWLRFLAYVIDSLVVGFASGIVGSILTGVVGGVLGATGRAPEAAAAAGAILGALVSLLVYWLYFSIMESSETQGTLGKMALGLAVTDGGGRPIGFGRATGRFFAKIVSAAPLGIGFVVAGFTGKKQALHDMIAGTLVVRRRSGGVTVVVVAVVAAGLAGVFILGVLAAIAIPNFVRYQLRAKSSEATALLSGLHEAQVASFAKTGKYVPLDVPGAGKPGAMKMPWQAQDLAAASAIGWAVDGPTYFAYRIAVGATEDGHQAYSVCAESDIDGDGKYAAVVLWQPVLDAEGKLVALPPAPPCRHDPELARSPLYDPKDPIGRPVRISPADVF